MRTEYVIRGGRVVDPAAGINELRDILVRGSKICSCGEPQSGERYVINAQGCLVLPGLIDSHMHGFCGGSNFAFRPELTIAQGTTAFVDAGTAGCATYESFHRNVISQSPMKIRAFLTPSAGGQLDMGAPESYDPSSYNEDRIFELFEKYPDELLGLKMRLQRGLVPENRAESYLEALISLADRIGKEFSRSVKVCVHTTDSPVPAEEIADHLREGDIFCHCHQGRGNRILVKNGKVDGRILAARERGVLFDAANNKGNFSIRTAYEQLEAGFLPDLIGSDLTDDIFNHPYYVKSLVMALSRYLSMGMLLDDLVRAVTLTPATCMGLAKEIGSLQPGFRADITILQEIDQRVIYRDWNDEEFTGERMLIPMLTMIGGKILYCQNGFFTGS